ncbi:MAG TPA: acireductone synthase [Candidatus Sulfotelmatobacter sp.]|nr:acireductone synthase [Candidatus Sulfotelmatobacter sp.]
MARAEWQGVCVLLLDIEGTTTPIDFVSKTLFPYASRNVESFLAQRFRQPEMAALVRDLKEQQAKDASAGLAPPPWPADSNDELRASVAYVQWLMARDSKCFSLKTLQGKIWQQGFENGELHGEVYADVPPAFARWRRQGREIAIYSSGSVLAQKLLFGTVPTGDLTREIAAFFDTSVGVKASAESYTRIAAAMAKTPQEFLFLSDAEKEVLAARSVGMFAALCDRERPPVESSADTITTFDEVLPD